MKTIYSILIAVLAVFSSTAINAQNSNQARQVLDKTAANIQRSKGGASANFSYKGGAGSISGMITIKGNKFFASTGQGKVWNNGKTQWTYTKSTNEVTVTTPNQAQRMSVNPYSFITMYKSGYRLSMKNSGGGYEVHLTAIHPARSIQEAYITVSRSYLPTQIRIKQGKSWSTVNVSNFRAHNVGDATFQFNKKSCPGAEVIDLR